MYLFGSLFTNVGIKLYSKNREKCVRALIDTASQRSYVREDTARELEYVSDGQQEVTHFLFGGIKSKSVKQDIFSIRLKYLNGSYSCNFSALAQQII